MDRGEKAIRRVLFLALVFGVGVLLLHPVYRHALISVIRGEPDRSPIWISNSSYYPEVKLYTEDTDVEPE